MGIARRAFCLAVVMFACTRLLSAQEGYLQLRVIDIKGQPIKGVRLIPVMSPRMPSKPTKDDGRTQILVTRYQAGKSISLELFEAPKNLILFPPIPPVPPSRCKTIMTTPPDPAEIILVTKAQKTLLESSRAITTIVSTLLENALTRSFSKGVVAEPRLSSLLELASLLELEPSDIDNAIRGRSRNSTEPYEKGLIALYEQDYSKATKELTAFLQGERTTNNVMKPLRAMNVSYTPNSAKLRQGQEKPPRVLGNPNVEQLDATFFLGQAFYEQGKYNEAANIYRKLVLLRPDDVTILATLGVSLYGAGEYQRAIGIFQEAFVLSERQGDRGLQAIVLNMLAGIHISMGQYDHALDLLNRSIALNRNVGNSEAEGRALLMIGEIYRELGEPSKALQYFYRSLEISRALSDRQLEIVVLSAIGTSAFDLLEYEKAILYFTRALEVTKQLDDKGAEGMILFDLAHVYLNVGKYDEAEKLFKHSVAIQIEIFGTNHPGVAHGLEGLGVLYAKQGKYDDAEKLFKQVLDIEERVLGSEHPDVVSSLNNLASLYSQQEKYSNAEALYKRALTIREKILGPEQTEVAYSLKALAGIYYKQEKYAEAEVLIRRALKIMERGLGQNHPNLIPILENYELLLRKTNRTAEANDIKKRVDLIRAKSTQKNIKP